MARYFFSSIERFDFHARTWVHFSGKLIFVQHKLLQNLKSKVVDRRFDNFYIGNSTLDGAFCFSNIKKGNFEIKEYFEAFLNLCPNRVSISTGTIHTGLDTYRITVKCVSYRKKLLIIFFFLLTNSY